MEIKQIRINGVIYDLPKDKNLMYEQTTPSKVWTIVHNLDKFPSINLLDANGVIMFADIKYVDMSTVEITFATEVTGKALLN
jgi:hypothetical protein